MPCGLSRARACTCAPHASQESEELQSQLAAIEKAALEQYNQVDAPMRAACGRGADGGPSRAPVSGVGATGAAAAAPQPSAGLPPGWSVQLSPQGVPFYYDAATRTSHWQLPAGCAQPHGAAAPVGCCAAAGAGHSAAAGAAPTAAGTGGVPQHGLPAGWSCAWTAQGVPYWVNVLTRESSWSPPQPAAAQQQPLPAAAGAAVAPAAAAAAAAAEAAPAAAAGSAAAAAPTAEAPCAASSGHGAPAAAQAPQPAQAQEPAQAEVDEASGLGAWTTVAVRPLEPLSAEARRELVGSDEEEEEAQAAHEKAADALERQARRMREAAGRARAGRTGGSEAEEGSAPSAAKPREAWADIVERMEDEGAGGDEAAIDSSGLLLGDNLVAHLQSHFPTKGTGGRALSGTAAGARDGGPTEQQRGEAEAAEEVAPQVDFKRRKVGAGKANHRRRAGGSAEDA